MLYQWYAVLRISGVAELKPFCGEKWAKIPPQWWKRLTASNQSLSLGFSSFFFSPFTFIFIYTMTQMGLGSIFSLLTKLSLYLVFFVSYKKRFGDMKHRGQIFFTALSVSRLHYTFGYVLQMPPVLYMGHMQKNECQHSKVVFLCPNFIWIFLHLSCSHYQCTEIL